VMVPLPSVGFTKIMKHLDVRRYLS
jgi:hypothetical protein